MVRIERNAKSVGTTASSTYRPAIRPLPIMLIMCGMLLTPISHAVQITVPGPTGSGAFGSTVAVLPNGNFVVCDPGFDAPGPITDVGAAYLYSPNGILISTLTGSTADDRVGSSGVTVLGTGNYVVAGGNWDNGALADAGAVTFGSATSGVSGVVSPANSLVGSNASDFVGGAAIAVLTNGNYVVRTPQWDNGGVMNAGAVTFGSAVTGVVGTISSANSLVGTKDGDLVGNNTIITLSNGNYVVRSQSWANGAATIAGAMTFGSGTTGITGAVSPTNSLVGTTANDTIGNFGIAVLANGNYVVRSPNWDNGITVNAGAVTFGSGTTGISGTVSATNSLVGSTAGEQLGQGGVFVLSNDNFVVGTPQWDNGAVVDAGAATLGSGTAGISGVITASNSLVGSATNDRVGQQVTTLANGNYVVVSPNWDNGMVADAGAATFGNGSTGITGVVSSANSLVGNTPSEAIGQPGVTPLSNGNYVVRAPLWDNGTALNAGAAVWGSGVTGITGIITTGNALVGTTGNDQVGLNAVPLTNGNYVVNASIWDNAGVIDAGAVALGNGTSGTVGAVSATNALVGSSNSDQVGSQVVALTNGNYVVISSLWDNAGATNAGAATFGSGITGVVGAVSPANSLVGTSINDRVGSFAAIALSSGNYVVRTSTWSNGTATSAGALTWGSGTSGISGALSPSNSIVGSTANDTFGNGALVLHGNGALVIRVPGWDNAGIIDAGAVALGFDNGSVAGPLTSANSVLGTVASGGASLTQTYDAQRNQLIVGAAAANQVVLFRPGAVTNISIIGDTPDPSLDNQLVTLTASINAATAPSDGVVTFRASTGESCVASTAVPTSPTTVNFSCSMVFTGSAVSTVIAEYTGSINHAYSRSGAEPHTSIIDNILKDGFE